MQSELTLHVTVTFLRRPYGWSFAAESTNVGALPGAVRSKGVLTQKVHSPNLLKINVLV